MSNSRSKSSFWDNALYLGLFILALVVLYELLKLWQAGAVKANGIISSIGTAFNNAIADVEAGVSSLVTAPATFFAGITSGLTSLVALLSSWVAGFSLANLFSGIVAFLSGLTGGAVATAAGSSIATPTTNAPIDTGLGASVSGTSPNPIGVTSPPTSPDPMTFTYDTGTSSQ